MASCAWRKKRGRVGGREPPWKIYLVYATPLLETPLYTHANFFPAILPLNRPEKMVGSNRVRAGVPPSSEFIMNERDHLHNLTLPLSAAKMKASLARSFFNRCCPSIRDTRFSHKLPERPDVSSRLSKNGRHLRLPRSAPCPNNLPFCWRNV